ncbi:MAG TPA: esterase [Burkholderiales bacterium]|nr:esterase [Burkholderiales bacterium]
MRAMTVLLITLLLAACTSAPYALRDMGSFHVGGRDVEISGKPVKEVVFTPGGVPAKIDLNGTYAVEAMYVQYFLPANRRGSVPLLMWHGGGLTGVSYESTPDGREGWLNYFVKQGWDTYNSDAVERGRAGWAMYPDIFKGEPVFLAKANPWERFRIGQGPGSWSTDPAQRKLMPNSQFPVEAYDNFVKQAVPRWTTTDDAIIRAYIALVDRVCPCVILFHSQAGQFGFKVAQARPDKVKALVAVEPAGVGDPKQAAALKGIPMLAVFGDNIALDSRWPQMRKNDDAFFDEITKAGGKVDVLDLPKAGLVGNSHMLMMDKNNLQVAALIQDWLAKQGLVR